MQTKTYPFSPALFPQIRYILLRLDPDLYEPWKFAWNEEHQDHLLELTATPDGFEKFESEIELWRIEKIKEHLKHLNPGSLVFVAGYARKKYEMSAST